MRSSCLSLFLRSFLERPFCLPPRQTPPSSLGRFQPGDDRRLEVIANGLSLHGGALAPGLCGPTPPPFIRGLLGLPRPQSRQPCRACARCQRRSWWREVPTCSRLPERRTNPLVPGPRYPSRDQVLAIARGRWPVLHPLGSLEGSASRTESADPRWRVEPEAGERTAGGQNVAQHCGGRVRRGERLVLVVTQAPASRHTVRGRTRNSATHPPENTLHGGRQGSPNGDDAGSLGSGSRRRRRRTTRISAKNQLMGKGPLLRLQQRQHRGVKAEGQVLEETLVFFVGFFARLFPQQLSVGIRLRAPEDFALGGGGVRLQAPEDLSKNAHHMHLERAGSRFASKSREGARTTSRRKAWQTN